MIRIWKFKGIVASYQYELTSYERFKYADHTYGVCTGFFRVRCKTLSIGTCSLDLYSHIFLDSFQRWKRLFYTLIVCFFETVMRSVLVVNLVRIHLNDAFTFISQSRYNVAGIFGHAVKLTVIFKTKAV